MGEISFQVIRKIPLTGNEHVNAPLRAIYHYPDYVIGILLHYITAYLNTCPLLHDEYIYRPKRSFGQGNVFTPVCHSVHRGGGSSWPGTPGDQTHTPPKDQTHTPRDHTPPDQAGTPPARPPRPGRNPPGPDPPSPSGIRSTFGRYASYWNAFLFWWRADKLTSTLFSRMKLLYKQECLPALCRTSKLY